MPVSRPFAHTFQVAWIGGASLLALLLFAALLVSLRLEKALTDLVEDRATLAAQQLADVVEGGLRFGVTLPDQTEPPRKIASLLQNDTDMLALALIDDSGRQVVGRVRTPPGPVLDTRTARRVLQRPPGAEPYKRVWQDETGIHVLMQVRDATGAVAGAVWVVCSPQAPQAAFAQVFQRLLLGALALTAGVCGLVAAWAWRQTRQWQRYLTVQLSGPDTARTTNPTDNPLPIVPLPEAVAALERAEAELTALESELTSAHPQGARA
jgi:hypothetical protein